MPPLLQSENAPLQLLQLTPSEFALFQELIYDKTGIRVSEKKSGMISGRLRRRLRALDLENFKQYHDLLADPVRANDEMPHFLSVVTTNETYFFRQEKFWQLVTERLLDEIAEKKSAAGSKAMRFWSGASSSGEEAYTLSIVVNEYLQGKIGWDVYILGSDISQRVLDQARKAEYNDYAISQMDPERIKRYFTRAENGELYRLRDDIRKMPQFKFHNLKDPMPNGRFDLVILRNVMMYFDKAAKHHVIENVTEATTLGGHLFVGDVDPAQDTKNLREGMKLEYVAPSLYQRSA